MKKLMTILLALTVSACSSTASHNAQSDEKLCRTYSNSYLAVASMKERGFSRKKSLACSLSSLTKNTETICNRQVPDEEYVKVIRYNSVDNKAMTRWMANIVLTVYTSPEMKPYEWRDQAFKRCKAIGAYE